MDRRREFCCVLRQVSITASSGLAPWLMLYSLGRLSVRLQQAQASAVAAHAVSPVLSFDKDDDDTLDFVASSANLRSMVFGIEPKSKFDIKRMSLGFCGIPKL